MASAKALINPDLLIWARESSGLGLAEAAERLRIPTGTLASWEEGSARPTVKQLRKLASKYKQSFAAFYLPEPPQLSQPTIRDFRRLPGNVVHERSPDLLLDVRQSMDRRSVFFELLQEQCESPKRFDARTTVKEEPEAVATRIRSLLQLNLEQQRKWRRPDTAFPYWREAIESQGILVFQSSKVQLSEMRGYSIAEFPLPVIVVNRKDTPGGRIFTMIHELVHLMLRSGGLCDLSASILPPEEQRIEVFCNHVAGAVLVPKNRLLEESLVKKHRGGANWDDQELTNLSSEYAVSREVILRRLLILGMSNEHFYRSKRAEFQQQYQQRPTEGFALPKSRDVVSAAGKPFVRLIMSAYQADRITASDVADYLGVKLRYFDEINEAIGA